MVKPYLSATLIDSSSQTEPPSLMFVLIPDLKITFTLSAKTKSTKSTKALLCNPEIYQLYLL